MPAETILLEARRRVLTSETTHISTTLGTAFVTLTRDPEGQPLELFLNVGKAGSDTYATAEALGRLISLALRLESPVSRAERAHELADQLESIGARMDVAEQHSIPDALARVLREALTESASSVPDNALPPEPVHPEAIAKAVKVLANVQIYLSKGIRVKN